MCLIQRAAFAAGAPGVPSTNTKPDRQFRRAVEREFEIIGEALNRLDHDDRETAEQIPELRRIVGFRTRIIHGYDAVDNATVWGIVEGRLPVLQTQVEALLK